MSDAVDAGPPTQPSLDARPDPFEPLAAEREPARNGHLPFDEHPPTEPFDKPADKPPPAAATPVVVPGQYHHHYVKRWAFVLVLIAVWLPAAAIGLGLYYLWFNSIDKTMPVFLLLIFLVVCTVAGLLLAMVERKPLVTAVALALLSAPGAATAAAAVLHGAYFFQWIDRPG